MNTVDGRNPAPPGMYNKTLQIMGFQLPFPPLVDAGISEPSTVVSEYHLLFDMVNRNPYDVFFFLIPIELGSIIPYMGVSKNRGTPKSSILKRFSIINHPFWGTTIFGNIHIP